MVLELRSSSFILPGISSASLPLRVPVFSTPRLLSWLTHLSYGAHGFLAKVQGGKVFEVLHI